MSPSRHPVHCILPPYVLEHLAESSDEKMRKLAIEAISQSAQTRGFRTALAGMPAMSAIPSPAGKKNRLVYDAKHQPVNVLPGKLVREEGDPVSKDAAVNEAYANAGHTYDFYLQVLERNSLDGNGMTLISSVHVGKSFNNAFWNGEQMAYGDGDGKLFLRFTKSLDVVAHELTHGVVTHTSNLVYQGEPGALNESFADVMGSLVKQWKRGETAKQADWQIGPDIMGAGVTATCLRTLTEKKAYANDPVLGDDPQPKHLKDKFTGSEDHGGVHINSGIPNHAFYLAATAIGGKAWQKAGLVWYKALLALTAKSDFADAAEKTIQAAATTFGAGSVEEKAVKAGWKGVGL